MHIITLTYNSSYQSPPRPRRPRPSARPPSEPTQIYKLIPTHARASMLCKVFMACHNSQHNSELRLRLTNGPQYAPPDGIHMPPSPLSDPPTVPPEPPSVAPIAPTCFTRIWAVCYTHARASTRSETPLPNAQPRASILSELFLASDNPHQNAEPRLRFPFTYSDRFCHNGSIGV